MPLTSIREEEEEEEEEESFLLRKRGRRPTPSSLRNSVGLPLSLSEKGRGVDCRENMGSSLLHGMKRDQSFSESEEEGAPPLSPSLKGSRHSFSEREGGLPITLSLKERGKPTIPSLR